MKSVRHNNMTGYYLYLSPPPPPPPLPPSQKVSLTFNVHPAWIYRSVRVKFCVEINNGSNIRVLQCPQNNKCRRKWIAIKYLYQCFLFFLLHFSESGDALGSISWLFTSLQQFQERQTRLLFGAGLPRLLRLHSDEIFQGSYEVALAKKVFEHFYFIRFSNISKKLNFVHVNVYTLRRSSPLGGFQKHRLCLGFGPEGHCEVANWRNIWALWRGIPKQGKM